MENQEFIDNFLLDNEIISEFDFELTYEEVVNKIKKFKKARSIFINGVHLRLTTDYKPKLEMLTTVSSDKVGKLVEYKIDSESEYNEFNYQLNVLYNVMTKEEIAYINDCLICGRSENYIKDKFNITRTNFDNIKKSGIIRFALAFNIAKYKLEDNK